MSQYFGDIRKPFFTWVLANILGFSALGILVLVVPSLMLISGHLGSTLIISIPISFTQWMALRRISHISIFWILSIPIAVLFIVLIIQNIPAGLWQVIDDESPLALTIGYLLIGFIIALPQWLILRRHYAYSSIWLLGSSLGVAFGSGLVIATDLINQSSIISYTVAVLIYAISTGLTLSLMLAGRKQSQSDIVSAA